MTTRRSFLAAPLIVPATALGRGATPPGDRITIGIIGSGNRALFEGKHFVPIDACQVVALCDVQETRRNEAQAKFEKLYSERKTGSYKGIRLYSDFRELLRQKDIDAVYIVTPDHWHVPILIAAMKAGKACHQEKPLGLSIEQDLAALKAVKKYRRPFFYGPERRSTPEARHGIELVLNGRIGKVKEIYVAAPPSVAGGSAEPAPVPKGFDFDMWLGPAPAVPFAPGRVGGMFHISDYCLGFIANWGAHPLDLVQWWADNAGLTIPVKYEGTGKLASGGLFDCATAWDLLCTYENGLLMHYMDGATLNRRTDVPAVLGPAGRRLANTACFVGTEGAVAVCYERVMTEPASLATSDIGPNEIHLRQSPRQLDQVTGKGIWDYPAGAHQLAWIESLRDGKPGVHSIETAVHTDLVCQLSDICVRTGRPVVWDPRQQKIVNDPEAAKMSSKPMRKPWDALS